MSSKDKDEKVTPALETEQEDEQESSQHLEQIASDETLQKKQAEDKRKDTASRKVPLQEVNKDTKIEEEDADCQSPAAAVSSAATRSRSKPGAFHISHPDATLTTASLTDMDVSMTDTETSGSSVGGEDVVIIPTATVVDETLTAQVTAGPLVEASEVLFDGDIGDRSRSANEEKTLKRTLSFKVKLLLVVLVFLVLSLVIGLTVALVQRRNHRPPPFKPPPRPPRPDYLQQYNDGRYSRDNSSSSTNNNNGRTLQMEDLPTSLRYLRSRQTP